MVVPIEPFFWQGIQPVLNKFWITPRSKPLLCWWRLYGTVQETGTESTSILLISLSDCFSFFCYFGGTLVIATLQIDPTAAWLRKVIGAANGVTLAFEGKIPWFEQAWLIHLRKTDPIWWVFVEGIEIEFLTRSRRNRMLGILGYIGVKMASVGYMHDKGECRRYLLTLEPLGYIYI